MWKGKELLLKWQILVKTLGLFADCTFSLSTYVRLNCGKYQLSSYFSSFFQRTCMYTYVFLVELGALSQSIGTYTNVIRSSKTFHQPFCSRPHTYARTMTLYYIMAPPSSRSMRHGATGRLESMKRRRNLQISLLSPIFLFELTEIIMTGKERENVSKGKFVNLPEIKRDEHTR